MVYVVTVGDLAAVVVEPQEASRQYVALYFIACARACGTLEQSYLNMKQEMLHCFVNKVNG